VSRRTVASEELVSPQDGSVHEHLPPGWRRRLRLDAPHSHDAGDKIDAALESSEQGIHALKWSLAGLGATALAQGAVVVLSGSVALLGDTLHNVADALTALPLWVAFRLGRRARTRRYTYGYGRSEDLAGLAIVIAILASGLLAGYESLRRLYDPQPVRYVGVVMAAGVIGFAGNELVARYRIRVGRRIGSAALVADGAHARTDGFTSLAVVAGAAGVALGWQRADAVVGLVITVAILFVLRSTARDVYRRLMDAVDPALVDRTERIVGAVPGVDTVEDVHIRWLGHRLRAEVDIAVAPDLSVVEGHGIATDVTHALLHGLPRLSSALVHVSPNGAMGVADHERLTHHDGSEIERLTSP
jgi:cation diffusion facilitator family transporter